MNPIFQQPAWIAFIPSLSYQYLLRYASVGRSSGENPIEDIGLLFRAGAKREPAPLAHHFTAGRGEVGLRVVRKKGIAAFGAR
ncbi:MAG: hypothetical protein ACREQK_11670 [Candidatus Binatia bacterium]